MARCDRSTTTAHWAVMTSTVDRKPAELDAPRLPTFFILGAGKSGTTSMHRYLGAHPDIFMSSVKEPTFFNTGFHVVREAQQYAALFREAGAARHIGESSHPYLTDPGAARTMRAFFPDARFILLLRDPVRRAHALYLHQRRWGWERARTFEEALELEARRERSRRFQRRCPTNVRNYRYVGSSRYDEQLARYFGHFDRSRFFVRTYEEFRADPRAVLDAAVAFLGLPPMPDPDLVAHNVNPGRHHLPVLRRHLCKAGLPGRAVAALLKGRRIPLPPLQPGTEEQLRATLESSVRRTAELLGRPGLWWLDDEHEPTSRYAAHVAGRSPRPCRDDRTA